MCDLELKEGTNTQNTTPQQLCLYSRHISLYSRHLNKKFLLDII
jgi:hypothetical protein